MPPKSTPSKTPGKTPGKRPAPRTAWKPGQNGNPLGIHPQKTLTKDAYALIIKLASLDKAETTMAHAVGISNPCWQAMKKRDPKLIEAIEYGRGLARDTYIAALQRHGKKVFIPYIFLLKGLHGVTEGAAPESSQPRITINIPGSARLVDYEPPKLIEHDE